MSDIHLIIFGRQSKPYHIRLKSKMSLLDHYNLGGRGIMNSQESIENLNCCIGALRKGNLQLKTLGIKKAQAEKAYRVKQAEEILKLKTEKHPATLIMELVKGNEEVAQLRLQRDIAESAYHNCISSIENLRVEIDAIKSKIKWLRAELNRYKH